MSRLGLEGRGGMGALEHHVIRFPGDQEGGVLNSLAITCVVALLTSLSTRHWGGGAISFAVWITWRVFGDRRILLPPSLPAWCLGLVSLVVGTTLSANGAAMQWAGLLQWLSLAGAVIALQDLLRSNPGQLRTVLWSFLAIGLVDGVSWFRAFLSDNLAWWDVRSPDLPVLPVRIRLFGSHGSTQAAIWLGSLVLIGVVWALPRIRSRPLAIGGIMGLAFWSLLLGFADSRLATVGLLMGAAGALLAGAGTWRIASLVVIPPLVWAVRDLVHPSRITTGGGIGVGIESVLLTGAVLVAAMALRSWSGAPIAESRLRRWTLGAGMGFCLLAPLVTIALDRMRAGSLEQMTTGRVEFWIQAWNCWVRHPLFGIGPWTFVLEYSRSHDWTFGFLAMHPHNAVLEVLLAGGVLLACAVVAMLVQVGLAPADEDRTGGLLAPLLGALGFAFTFDSPMGSPQVLALTILSTSMLLASVPGIRWDNPPRSLVLVPLLLLVPIARIFEAQTRKAHLLEASRLVCASRWEEASREILAGLDSSSADPQVMRNTLLARTTLYSSVEDSLPGLDQDWQRMVSIEPGFLPNRIHASWVRWKRTGDPAKASEVLEGCRILARESGGWTTIGDVSPRWRSRYPSDDPAYWRSRLARAVRAGDSAQARWISEWFAYRFPPVRRVHAGGALIPIVRNGVEKQLYGSDGTSWLLVPQLAPFFLRAGGLAERSPPGTGD